jgi:hypothetical protein
LPADVAVVTGTVVDRDGKPAAGANIEVDNGDHLLIAGQLPSVADQQGNFTIKFRGAVQRRVVITATAEGQIGYTLDFILRHSTSHDLGDPIRLARTGSITGHVVGPDGRIAAHVAIAYLQPYRPIMGAAGQQTPLEHFMGTGTSGPIPPIGAGVVVGGTPAATTDDNGDFTITGLPVGTFIVTAARESGDASGRQLGSEQPVEVTEGAETKLALPLRLVQCGSISGTVVDEAGNPAAGAQIAVNYPAEHIAIPGATCDSSGAFTIHNVPPGKGIDLSIRMPPPNNLGINSGNTDIDLSVSIPIVYTNVASATAKADVEAGAETKMREPIVLRAAGGRGNRQPVVN